MNRLHRLSLRTLLAAIGLLAITASPIALAQANQPARRIISGPDLPPNCVSSVLVKDVFFKTGSGAGQYVCTSASTWTQQSASGAAASVTMGGTGQTSLTLNNVLLGNGASAVQFVAPGTSGNVLTSNGTTWTSAAPTGSLTSQTLTPGTVDVVSNAVRAVTVSTFSWDTADLIALGAVATGELTIATAPAKTVIVNAYIKITLAEADAPTLTVSLGRTGASYIDYIVASDAKAAANTIYGNASGERGTNLTGYDLPSWTATTPILAQFVVGGTFSSDIGGSAGTIVIEHYTIP